MKRAKKSLGQHFLTSISALSTIIHSADITSNDVVLEIGPGRGILTRQLLTWAGKVIAVEKDRGLIGPLTEMFTQEIQTGKLDVLERDILDFDPEQLRVYNHPYKVVANIPYYITGEILRMFLGATYRPESMVLLVQKEVAERIVAKNGKESVLSLSVKFFGTPTYIQTVKRGSFSPSPKVDSAILKIEMQKRIENGGLRVEKEEEKFFKIVKIGFKSKRKKLISNLASVAEKEKLERIFTELSLDHNIRAEDVPFIQWKEIVTKLS